MHRRSSGPGKHQHAGIVLAGGASARMGSPKALLPCPNGWPLVIQQASTLYHAGYDAIYLVLGAAHNDILSALSALPYVHMDINDSIHTMTISHANTSWSCQLCNNPQWEKGRLTSIQTGVQHALNNEDISGCTILPIDTPGIASDTLRHMHHLADMRKPQALRPLYADQKGKVVWLSRTLCNTIVSLEPVDTRLDQWLCNVQTTFATEDPAILNNINTPKQWSDFLNTR